MTATRYVRLTAQARPGVATGTRVLRVPRATAEAWVEQGIAEYAEAPVETAMQEIGRAARPKGRGGRGVEQRG